MWPFKKKDEDKKYLIVETTFKDLKKLKECYPLGTKIKYLGVDMVVYKYNSHYFNEMASFIYDVKLWCNYVNSHGEIKSGQFSYDEAMTENTALIKAT